LIIIKTEVCNFLYVKILYPIFRDNNKQCILGWCFYYIALWCYQTFDLDKRSESARGRGKPVWNNRHF